MRRKMVAGNWKMHGSLAFTREMMQTLATELAVSEQVVALVCPPSLYLTLAVEMARGLPLQVGAQNCAQVSSSGAYTGEISPEMLVDVGCRYVIVGHSERRSIYGETDQLVAQKTQAALAANLTPIICVGETLAEREANQAQAVIAKQLEAVSQVIGAQGWARSIIAYEPVWAIGTGKTATPEQAQEMHAFIRRHLSSLDASLASGITILYGGSVKADNAAAIFAQPDVDGGLIGGASLKSDEFIKIYTAALTA